MSMPADPVSAPFDPRVLDDEATRSSDFDLLGALNQGIASAPKRRGRPLGSRNRPKITPGPGVIGGGHPLPPKGKDKPDPIEVARAKKAKADEYAARIVDELNDNIMLLFSGLGVPQQFLFQPGMAPAVAKVSDKYTELGNMLAIKPTQAKAIASFLAEAEFSDTGAKVAATVGSGNGALILKGLFALGAIVQYVNGLNGVRKQLEPLIQAYHAAQQQQHNGQGAPAPTTVGGLS